MLKTNTSGEQSDVIKENVAIVSLSQSLALMEAVSLCEEQLTNRGVINPSFKRALYQFPESAKTISSLIKRICLPEILYKNNNLYKVLSVLKSFELMHEKELLLGSSNFCELVLSQLNVSQINSLYHLIKSDYDQMPLLKKVIENESMQTSVSFLCSIRQEGLIPFALTEGNEGVIVNIKRLIESSIPKTLVCQIKSQLHEICACSDLVLLLKTSHNNRKQFIALKLFLVGVKNKKKIDKFVENKKKVKTLFNKLAKPIKPISQVLEEIKKKLADKKQKSRKKMLKIKVKTKHAKHKKVKKHQKHAAKKKKIHSKKSHGHKGAHHSKGSHAAHAKHKAHHNIAHRHHTIHQEHHTHHHLPHRTHAHHTHFHHHRSHEHHHHEHHHAHHEHKHETHLAHHADKDKSNAIKIKEDHRHGVSSHRLNHHSQQSFFKHLVKEQEHHKRELLKEAIQHHHDPVHQGHH